jgi:rhamnulokinase
MAEKVYLAADLGASSGRVMAGLFDGERIRLAEVHRFPNGAVVAGGSSYWDLLGQWEHILTGLAVAAGQYGDQVVSVGVDTWGVDFGLLGRGDTLLGNPYHYRDRRTQGMFEVAFAKADRAEIFAETGLQFMEFNTLYQLLAMQQLDSPLLKVAESLLMIPDLFHWLLTGVKANELTDASTTQIYNPVTRDWSAALIDRFGLPAGIFGPLVEPGTTLGPLLPQVAAHTGLSGVNVVLPATHDTASAVLAVPAVAAGSTDRPDWCYISSGTWSLIGVEVARPVVTDDCLRLNFTNEGGVAGTTRLLKNVAGLWLLQECRRIWKLDGRDYSWDDLQQLAAAAAPLRSLINPDDPALHAPARMPDAICAACKALGQPVPESDGAMVRCILESLALKSRQVVGWLEELTGGRLAKIHIVGGGTQNQALCQMTADACNRPVIAGPVEATAAGNLLLQARAAGDIDSIADAREVVRRSFEISDYEPTDVAPWDDALGRFMG